MSDRNFRLSRSNTSSGSTSPEPRHYAWLATHFRDNGLEPSEHKLIRAAVCEKRGRVDFYCGNSAGWYGQAIAPRRSTWARLGAFVHRIRPKDSQDTDLKVISVRSISLSQLLQSHPCVDLIDLDVQGEERTVLTEAIEQLDAKVKRVHVGTHSAEIEDQLRKLFSDHAWRKVNDYRCLSINKTPYGEIEFVDGVQTWINPRL